MSQKEIRITFDQNVLDLICGVNGKETDKTGAHIRKYLSNEKIYDFVPDSFFPIENLQRLDK